MNALPGPTAENGTEAAILSRRSVRGYLPDPVPRDVVEHLLNVAARAPSGTNMQPWDVIALAGAPLTAFCDHVTSAYLAGEDQGKTGHTYYPHPMPEPFLARRRKVGWDLYGLLGIARGETEKTRAHLVRNLNYFGAPVGLILTIDSRLLIGSWIDMGMFLENISVAARARGLDSCAMAVFSEFPRAVKAALGIGDDRTVVCGMAIGFEDRSMPANALVTERVAAREFTRFEGFPD
jgi:nitroreductase